MHKLNLIYSLFILAALLFVAKPFLGFQIQESLSTSSNKTSVIVKAFSKRKPESLAEAKERKSAISFQLNHPPANLLVTILSFLALLFPFSNVVTAIRRSLASNFYNDSPIYLLTCNKKVDKGLS